MAYQSIWYFTDLPDDIVNIINNDLFYKYSSQMEESKLHGDNLDKKERDSKNTWIPSTHWVGGFIWHYVMRTNRENFLYDISHIQYNNIQFSRYEEGDFYTWHLDQDVKSMISSDQEVRKLSFSLQLSKDEDYVGGILEFTDVDNETFIAPRDRGCLIIFDSRTIHRVSPIESGVRESLVGWVVGPRWK